MAVLKIATVNGKEFDKGFNFLSQFSAGGAIQ